MPSQQNNHNVLEETSIYISFQSLDLPASLPHQHESASPPPPPYNSRVDVRTPLLPRTPEADAEIDDESLYGFWGERTDEDKDISCSALDGFFVRYKCVSVLGYILLVIMLVLNVDFLLARVGLSTVNWGGVSGAQSAKALRKSHSIHFCLSSMDREAPGPHTWHFMPPRSSGECKTRMLTLMAGPGDEWTLLSGDEMVFGGMRGDDGGREREDRFIKGNI